MQSNDTYTFATIADDVLTTRFACDLKQCKGACCTLQGGRGAPITDEERAAIADALPAAAQYLSAASLKWIEQHGFCEGDEGGRALECIEHKDCVFVFYERGVARCALERAYQSGERSFRKPRSCHLFPIRVTAYGDHDHIYIERIPECESGYRNGEMLGVKAIVFLREALERAYGSNICQILGKER